MNSWTHLYHKAKSLQTEKAWNDYRILKNKIANSIRNAYTKYQINLFPKDGRTNHKNFLKYIKNIHKDQHGISPLNNDDGNTVNSSKEKANKLTSWTANSGLCLPLKTLQTYQIATMPDITISCDGVQKLNL